MLDTKQGSRLPEWLNLFGLILHMVKHSLC